MKQYRLKQWYPSLYDDIEVGVIVDYEDGWIYYTNKRGNKTAIEIDERELIHKDFWELVEEDGRLVNPFNTELPIDKVTIKNLDVALRMVGIQLDVNIIDKVIDLVELIENKGDDVTIKDIVSLQETWKRHLLKYGPVLIC